MSAVKERSQLAEKIAYKRGKLKELFDNVPDMKFSETQLHELESLKTEIDEESKNLENLDQMIEVDAKNRAAIENADRTEDGWPHPNRPLRAGEHAAPDRMAMGAKSVGQMFVESEAFTGYKNRRGPEVTLDAGWLINSYFGQKHLNGEPAQKAPFTTADWPYAYPNQPGVTEHLSQQPMIADLLPSGETTQNQITFVQENAWTNAADFVAESGPYPESNIDFDPATANVHKIATYIPVTDEQMDDLPMMRSIVDSRLRTFLALKEDHALLNGTGLGGEFAGLYNVANIQTQAKATDEPVTDTLFKAITNVETAFMSPSGIVMHPLDWQKIQLMRSADGTYIWGSPSDPAPRRVWGLPVVTTTQASAGTALVGAFNTSAQIFRREGITIEVSNSHGEMFINGQLAVRADTRLALVVYRPSGICEVTGI